MDSISKVFYNNFTISNCDSLCPNALELHDGSWITYGRQLKPIDEPDEMPNHTVNDNWSSTAPMEGLFKDDDDLALSKRAQTLRHPRKTITGREMFL